MVRAPGTHILYQQPTISRSWGPINRIVSPFKQSHQHISPCVRAYNWPCCNGKLPLATCELVLHRETRMGRPVPTPVVLPARKDDLANCGIYKSFAKLISLKVLRFWELIPVAQPHVQSRRWTSSSFGLASILRRSWCCSLSRWQCRRQSYSNMFYLPRFIRLLNVLEGCISM